MMKLLSNALSPYGRKVKLTIAVKSLGSQIEMVIVDTNPGTNVEINSANPLGKIPSLVLDDKKPIFDSNVICEYLDSLKPAPVLFPRNGPERWQALALGSLADGILDAALLLVYEKRFRPEEKWHAPWQQAPAGQDRPRARSAREEPASLERQPRLRPSHACLRPRLSRFPARRQMACRTS
jgi:glutathione S-transferase